MEKGIKSGLLRLRALFYVYSRMNVGVSPEIYLCAKAHKKVIHQECNNVQKFTSNFWWLHHLWGLFWIKCDVTSGEALLFLEIHFFCGKSFNKWWLNYCNLDGLVAQHGFQLAGHKERSTLPT